MGVTKHNSFDGDIDSNPIRTVTALKGRGKGHGESEGERRGATNLGVVAVLDRESADGMQCL